MRKLNYKKELLRIFYTCGQVRILYINFTQYFYRSLKNIRLPFNVHSSNL
jgi:hypothetical protein